jgi:hypothetical protein
LSNSADRLLIFRVFTFMFSATLLISFVHGFMDVLLPEEQIR